MNFKFWKKTPVENTTAESSRSESPSYRPNPFKTCRRSFYSTNVDQMLNGWTSQSHSIDLYLASELVTLRARARELVRQNPYAKRFVTAIKSNIVGAEGVTIQAQSTRLVNGLPELDTLANTAIETAFKDWASYHCDYRGRRSFVDLQNLAISTAGQDGEFLFRVYQGRRYGKYGFQLDCIDPELLDVTKNTLTSSGEIRLGVEYNHRGKPIWYHFRERTELGMYNQSRTYKVAADEIIHGFIDEWPDQSRGVPWMHASLARLKNLDKYDETAMIASRFGASGMLFLSSDDNGDDYEGDESANEDGEDELATLQHVEPGSIKNIGSHKMQDFDPRYPHELYDTYHKANLRSVSSGIGVSYHSISNDLKDVNFSSIRAGVMEDREIYKSIQSWFIRQMVKPVYERWLSLAILNQSIRVGKAPLARAVTEYFPAHYQARRWDWVDPAKDGAANDLELKNRTTSRSQIMRDKGRDPEQVWNEIEREENILKSKGLLEANPNAKTKATPQEEQPNAD